jgi:DNA helicase-2/ATP-dependent DNA helicase PcrA
MPWSDGLSEEQRNAASYHGSHARLLAGPGTGKTFSLTRRILYLIENQEVNPLGISVLTFTRAAAAELRARIKQELNDDTPAPKGYQHSILFL